MQKTENSMPLWDVWFEEDDSDREDCITVRAIDAGFAAERACMQRDRDWEYDIITRGFADGVKVAPHGDNDADPIKFNIKAITEPVYIASRVTPESED